MRIRPLTALAPLLLALGLGGTACGTLSVEDEKSLGRGEQRRVREAFTLMRDRVTVKYVRDLGEDLAAHSRPTPFEFRFYVIEDETLNAFAVPGGAIYVNTGLILAVGNVSELAGVMAHEIGHVTARHTAEQYNNRRGTAVVTEVLKFVIYFISGNPYIANAGTMATDMAGMAYLSTFGRDAEREADELAVETLVNAGYDPMGLATMFQTLQAESGGGGYTMPQFLSTHPASAERIESAKRAIADLDLSPDLRKDDGKLEIIQQRIELIIGTDSDVVVEEDGDLDID